MLSVDTSKMCRLQVPVWYGAAVVVAVEPGLAVVSTDSTAVVETGLGEPVLTAMYVEVIWQV